MGRCTNWNIYDDGVLGNKLSVVKMGSNGRILTEY